MSSPGDARITIVGLGPGDPDRRTIAVQRALDAADRIVLRSFDHPGLDDLIADPRVTDASSVSARIDGDTRDWAAGARYACDLAQSGNRVVVAAPGHPMYGERLVIETLHEAAEHGIPTVVLDGLSTLDLSSSALAFDAMVDEVQIVDGAAIVHAIGDGPFGGGQFPFTPLRPMLISRVYNQHITSRLQALLSRLFPTTHPITIVDAAGHPTEQAIREIPLADLAQEPGARRLSLWVPPMDPLTAGRDPRTLQYIGARLRRPDGCPWDREQTHASLAPSFVDEVYEVVDAIEAGHTANLAEELGDIYLHIVMQAQIAEEAGEFTLEDVFEGISAKIVRRHPHVFGDDEVKSSIDVVGLWQRVKD
ncbi:MAG TPA: MazG nucleotide pyrophosphohydrolase domain-containing protein, partial [Thermomicrobiales bacterium]|nr:MazG nucleotide pyrophosphohydrolase domain-containing protein [Thermomicrobiales bacterium]